MRDLARWLRREQGHPAGRRQERRRARFPSARAGSVSVCVFHVYLWRTRRRLTRTVEYPGTRTRGTGYSMLLYVSGLHRHTD